MDIIHHLTEFLNEEKIQMRGFSKNREKIKESRFLLDEGGEICYPSQK